MKNAQTRDEAISEGEILRFDRRLTGESLKLACSGQMYWISQTDRGDEMKLGRMRMGVM